MGETMKIWEWLNGKKTYIGAGLYLAGLGWEYMGWQPPGVGTGLKTIGEALGGLGLLHKSWKFGEAKGFGKGVESCQDENKKI